MFPCKGIDAVEMNRVLRTAWGLGNYLNKQHSSKLLSRRSSILQVPSGWCTVIAVADMRVDGGIGTAIRPAGDLSGRERGERHLSADLADQTDAGAQCGPVLFAEVSE
jgi:hypothetical protein